MLFDPLLLLLHQAMILAQAPGSALHLLAPEILSPPPICTKSNLHQDLLAPKKSPEPNTSGTVVVSVVDSFEQHQTIVAGLDPSEPAGTKIYND